MARCFTRDGVVLDEGHAHAGPAAIEAWKTDASTRYSYTATPHTLEHLGRSHLITSTVSGDFPGRPLDLRYAFTLERGKIARLEIGA